MLALGRRAGAAVELHVLEPPTEELWRRLARRTIEPSSNRASTLEAEAAHG